MYFGLLNTDIVNSFSQATLADFAVGVISGGAIIDAEIAFKYEELMSSLPPEFLQIMERVSGEVATVSISGTFTPSFYAQPATLRAYITDKGYSPCPGQSLEGTSMCWQSQNNQVTLEAANIQNNGSNSYSILDTFDYTSQNLTLYYDVDQDNLTINSLKSVLRSMVCSSLGSRIYPVGQSADAWSIVKYYCEDSQKWLDYFLAGNFPAEYKKMKLLNKKSGITTIKLVRS